MEGFRVGMKERGRVWLGAAGLVENEKGEWLVAMKRYGGLKGNVVIASRLCQTRRDN